MRYGKGAAYRRREAMAKGRRQPPISNGKRKGTASVMGGTAAAEGGLRSSNMFSTLLQAAHAIHYFLPSRRYKLIIFVYKRIPEPLCPN